MEPLDETMDALAEGGHDLVAGYPMFAVGGRGKVLVMAGRHIPTATCWCQPDVERCSQGHPHRVEHKRCMDMDDEAYDEIGMARMGEAWPGWCVIDRGGDGESSLHDLPRGQDVLATA